MEIGVGWARLSRGNEALVDIELLKKERRKLMSVKREQERTREKLVPRAEEDVLNRIIGEDNTG